MVGVDNHLQVVRQAPVHHFFYTCEPSLVNTHGLGISDMTLPADRNTYGVEACFLDGLDGLFRHYGIAPCCLGLDTAVGIAYSHRLAVLSRGRTLKLVTQVPSYHASVPFLGSRL